MEVEKRSGAPENRLSSIWELEELEGAFHIVSVLWCEDPNREPSREISDDQGLKDRAAESSSFDPEGVTQPSEEEGGKPGVDCGPYPQVGCDESPKCGGKGWESLVWVGSS